MKNKIIKLIGCLFIALPVFGVSLLASTKNAEPAAAVDVVEEESDSLYINDLSGFVGTGATLNASTNNIDSIVAGGRAGFITPYKNIHLKATVNFSALNWFQFYLRSNCTSTADAVFSGGYSFRIYSNFQYEYIKNNVSVIGPAWGPHAALALDTDYDLEFSTVNCDDGSVHVKLVFDGATVIDVYDSESPILEGGAVGIVHDGCAFSVKGKGLNTPIINSAEIPTVATSSNFPASIDANGKITTSAEGVLGVSGAVYSFQSSTSEFGYVTKVKASAADGRLGFQIGGINGGHEYNRPNIIGDWGWADTGYIYYWSANGQRHFGRNAGDFYPAAHYSWLSGFTADTEYKVEMSIKETTIGNRIVLKIDDVIQLNYFDLKSDLNTPLVLPKSGQPGGLVNTFGVYSFGVSSTFQGLEKSSYGSKTVISNDLGTPVTNNESSFSKNGEVIDMKDGVAVGYNANLINNSVKFKANFSSVNAIGFMLNYQGDKLDQIWGGDWAKKGYSIILYANGQINFAKNGITLTEGWCTTGFGLTTSTDYEMEFGSYKTGDVERVFFKLGENYLFNFIDFINPINQAGWFAVQNIGTTGSLKALGVDIPVISAEESVNIGETIDLVLENEKTDDDVAFYIDEDLSEGEGTIVDREFTGTVAGDVYVYAIVNELYSNSICINVVEGKVPVLIINETNLVVGGEPIELAAKFKDDSSYTTCTYNITPVTGDAQLKQGNMLYGTKAGTIKVSVTLDDKTSDDTLLYVTPKIFIKNTTALAVGGIRELDFEANCDLPEENINAVFTLISGSDCVDFDSDNNTITGLKVGTFSMKVVVTGETFSGTSQIVEMAVEDPIVVLTKEPGDMVVGQEQLIEYEFGHGEVPVTDAHIEVSEGASLVQVDGMKLTAIGAGSVHFKVCVNGVYSLGKTILISKLDAQIVAGNMKIDSTQKLSVIFNDESFVVNKIEYSVIEGADFASIEGDVITSKHSTGVVVIQAKINDEFIINTSIVVYSKLYITGISPNSNLLIDYPIEIGYFYDGDEEIKSLNFNVSDTSIAKVETKDGVHTLSGLKEGSVTLSVEVNGNVSDPINVNVKYRVPVSLILIGGQREFKAGEKFNHDGMIVMAVDENGGQFDVTKYCNFSVQDNKDGTAVVTVTYKQGRNELSTTYTITYESDLKKEDNTMLIVGTSVGAGVTVICAGIAAGIIIKNKKGKGKKNEKGE